MESYQKVVDQIESDLAPYAMKSFDSHFFIDGAELFKYYQDIWTKDTESVKLSNRTPIQHQRDRILYSNGVRKQAERYHVLYQGGHRILRNYITHTMRMMQVTRTICRGLHLNEDFAEAIVLGSKLGALPFIHASKGTVSNWIISKISKIDSTSGDFEVGDGREGSLGLVENNYLPDYPEWIRRIKSKSTRESVETSIPFGGLDSELDGAYLRLDSFFDRFILINNCRVIPGSALYIPFDRGDE